jgi:hypothetical protein
MEVCDMLLQTNLRNTIGPHGDLRQAYRDWYRQQMCAHDATIQRMVERFSEALSDAS